ncbi:hypothetical protein A2960_00810 [Candidatus Gottesmanbacteria bacterium RIFCSPLOWO2_01_FULL_39_12b]|uniref:Acetyltransferase n=1 Tax=Candidatus Gottesmanbacteria bacterium RIFCSPLOWO2_01_FULL_39_12b TaxID=1798388 RepID=A0A1F6APS4_9BACT|nr:MAG: hypothetical protein A2960_00810 [Candidatus Gottesmanbacteria bacterium RIFCSPLOWO2_01_FULL_39_12b]
MYNKWRLLREMKRRIVNQFLIRKTSKKKHCYLKLGNNVYLPILSDIKTAVTIGNGTGINGKITIMGGSKVSIGKYCAIGSDVKIISSNHDVRYANLQSKFQLEYFAMSLDSTKGEVKIGNNVWIADSAIILSGVTIGDGAVVAAGAVVVKDIPPFCIAAGIPAVIKRERFSKKIVDKLLAIQWWDWDEKMIKRNKDFFTLDLTKNPNFLLEKIIHN